MSEQHDPLCPYVQALGFCACISIMGARESTAKRIEASITTYANSLTGKREQSVALTCASLAVP